MSDDVAGRTAELALCLDMLHIASKTVMVVGVTWAVAYLLK